jgi:hypothetical protein
MGAYNYDIPYPDPPVVGAYNYPWVPRVSKSNLCPQMNIFRITYFLVYFLCEWLPDNPYPDPPVVMGAYNYDIPYPDPPVVGAYNYPCVPQVSKRYF